MEDAAVNHHLLTNFVLAAFLGVVLFILSRFLRVSAIVLLLIGGVLAGPEFLGLVHPQQLGAGLNTIISLAVGIILFEGGLTLDVKGYRQVSGEIWGILTKGVLVTFLGITLCLYFIFDFDLSFCFLSASLIIVTGPTVIGPILQRIRVKKKLHHILHWEGVLIDPIGVFIALLCYEWYISTGDQAALNFFTRFFAGAVVGLGFGFVLYQILKRNWIPEESLNIFVLASAMLNFMVADIWVVESGLLSVTITGLYLGYKPTPNLARIIEYKVELKDFLIGLLFILLASQLELKRFLDYGTDLIWVVLLVMFLIRPLNIFISSIRSTLLSMREKLFLSWIAPRGIVAASMASLFAFQLEKRGVENARFLETLTYSVIVGTVFFQGFTARWVGKLLKVLEPVRKDWLIVGSHHLARKVATFIQAHGDSVILLDTNPREVKLANSEGIPAMCENAMVVEPEHRMEFYGVGNVLAITPNEDLNRLVCQRWGKLLKGARLFRYASGQQEEAQGMSESDGSPVWEWLHLKALLAQDPRENPIDIRSIDVQSLEYDRYKALACYRDGSMYVGAPDQSEGEATLLAIEPREEDVSSSLDFSEDRVLFCNDLSLDQLYSEMLGQLSEEIPQLNKEEILADLIEREQEFSSLIGHGIALPHTYSGFVTKTQLVVARVEPGIPCQHTQTDISMVFMLLSPEGNPVEHLNQISKIAKFVMKEETRNAILGAHDANELYRVLKTY